jgi:acyl-CoA thioester hydrolase
VEEQGGTFRFRHPVDVRFKDIDAGGHAHHSHGLVYFEEARWAYWDAVVGRAAPPGFGYILAEATVRWHKRVFWPLRLDVGVRVGRLGKKHFDMAYEVRSPEGDKLISGSTVQVWYDYEISKSVRIPEEVVAAIRAWEGSEAER